MSCKGHRPRRSTAVGAAAMAAVRRPRRLPPRVVHRTDGAAGGQHHVLRRVHQRLVVRRGLTDDWVTTPSRPFSGQYRRCCWRRASCSSWRAARSRPAAGRSSTAGGPPAPVLGILFLGGQALAWQQLNDAGIFISTNPSSSFFYVLTAAHAVHLLGGVCALFYVDVQALRLRSGPASAPRSTSARCSGIFWMGFGFI